MTATPNAAVLERVLDPVGSCLTADVARRLVVIRADPALEATTAEELVRLLSPRRPDEP